MKSYADHGISIPPGKVSSEIYTLCPECSATRTKKNVKCLAVNLDKRCWHCHHCGWSGGLSKHEDKAKPENAPQGPSKLKPIHRPSLSDLTPQALEWLALRGISKEVAERAGLKSAWRVFGNDGRRECLAIPFFKSGETVNIKYRRLDVKQHQQSKGGEQCLYRFDDVKGARTVIITEGELDSLAIMQAGCDNVCSCPAGAPPVSAKDLSGKLAFLDDAESIFQNAESVVLAMDVDEVGLRWSEAIADHIGREKCWRVKYPTGAKDANEVLMKYGADILAERIQNPKPCPVPGLTTFSAHWSDIESYYDNPDRATGESTGFDTLDEFYRLKRGTLSVLTGIPQSGKSEFLDQIILNTVRLRSWKWCMFSPENYPPEFHAQKLAEKWTGKPMFKRWSAAPMTKQELKAAVSELSKTLFLITPSENSMTLDDVLLRAKVSVLRYGVQGLVLDPYNELEHVRPAWKTETEYVSEFLSRCRTFARMYDVAFFIVAHPTKLQKLVNGDYPVPTPYDISGSANWRNKADACLAVWRSYQKDDGLVAVHVQKVRDKNQGKNGSVQFQWTKATGTFSEMRTYEHRN